MKSHLGVDAGSGYVHTRNVTAAQGRDVEETTKHLREDSSVVYGDIGYNGANKRKEIKNDLRLLRIEFHTNVHPSSLRSSVSYPGIRLDKQTENRKCSM